MDNQYQVGITALKKIPVIVAAMTQEEYQSLTSGPTPNASTHIALSQFLKALQKNNIDMSGRYGKKREEWRPFGKDSKTIEDLVDGLFGLYREEYSLEPDLSLVEDFFHADSTARRTTWTDLKQRGWCFLIIDGVSMYHSEVRNYVVQALNVVRHEQVAMVVLSPFDVTRHEVHSELIKLINDECGGIMTRYEIEHDPKVDILSGDSLCFHRWLRVHMERTRAEMEQKLGKMDPTKRNIMRTLQPSAQPFSP